MEFDSTVLKFGWLKDTIPNEQKFGHPRYGFSAISYRSDIDSIVRHSLFDENVPGNLHQANLSSCTSNALVTAFIVRLTKQKLSPQDLSRLFLYFEQRVRQGTVNEDSGTTIYSGIQVLNSSGICIDQFCQYIPSKFKERPSSQAYQDALKHTVIDSTPVQQDLREMKQHLLDGHPIVFGFMVYASFMSDYVKKTGNLPLPLPGERCFGGHAVMIFGFDDNCNGGSFLCRNSWGREWGVEGNFYMKYTQALNKTLCNDFWAIKNVKVQ